MLLKIIYQKRFIGLLMLAAVMSCALAEPKNWLTNKQLKQQIQNQLNLKVISASTAPLSNLIEIITSRGILYISRDGKLLIQGDIYNLNQGVNKTKDSLAKWTKKQLAKISNTIDYKAKTEKYVIHVFTDISCPYCVRLHKEMKEYHDNGISVHYLAYPRADITSTTFKNMRNIWCTKKQQQAIALDSAMNRLEVKPAVDLIANCNNFVAAHKELGNVLNITGTPVIILPNGQILSGYVPAKRLLKILEQQATTLPRL